MTTPSQAPINTAAEEFLRRYLADRDINCPSCGYNLRNLTGQRCPECGEEIVIQIGLAEPKLFAPIAGLIALAAGAGFNGLLLLYVFVERVIRHEPMGELLQILTVLGIGFVVLTTCMTAWLRGWRQVRRQGAGIKILLVLGAWVVTIADLLIFSFTIR